MSVLKRTQWALRERSVIKIGGIAVARPQGGREMLMNYMRQELLYCTGCSLAAKCCVTPVDCEGPHDPEETEKTLGQYADELPPAERAAFVENMNMIFMGRREGRECLCAGCIADRRERTTATKEAGRDGMVT